MVFRRLSIDNTAASRVDHGGMASSEKYLIAGCRPWNRDIFDAVLSRYPGEWHFVATPEELTPESVAAADPRFLFFLHWSWKVSKDLIEKYECIGFHPTDLPFGRGGTPIQNLILRGIKTTKLSAFRMTDAMDTGPVYLKESLSLKGSAGEIYRRMNRLAAGMIREIVDEKPSPVPQQGEVVLFERRRPEQSEIPPLSSLEALYDFIRMTDAEEYPKAFLNHGGFRFEFGGARLSEEGLAAVVKIRPVPRKR